MPPAVLPGLGDIDHAGNALNDGPVLGLRHGELVRQLPLASDHSLPVGEQHGLPRHRKADDDRQGDACGEPQGPVQLRRGDQADDERSGDDHAGQRKQAAHERLGRQGNGGAHDGSARSVPPGDLYLFDGAPRKRIPVLSSLGRQPETAMTRKYLRRLALPWSRAALPLRRLHEQLR